MGSEKLCVSLTPETLEDVFASDVSGVDCVEVRLDYLKDPRQSKDARWDRLPVPVIATCRGKERGGLFTGTLDDEIAILQSAAANGARYVDIDYRYARPFPPADVIASYHNFDKTPDDLSDIVNRALATSAQIAKVATQVNRWEDNRRLLDLLARPARKPLIVSGMGDIGQITRIVGPSRGSFLSYAASTRQAAPGQTHRARDAANLQIQAHPAIDKASRNSRNAGWAFALTCPAQSRLRNGESRFRLCEAACGRS